MKNLSQAEKIIDKRMEFVDENNEEFKKIFEDLAQLSSHWKCVAKELQQKKSMINNEIKFST